MKKEKTTSEKDERPLAVWLRLPLEERRRRLRELRARDRGRRRGADKMILTEGVRGA